MIKIFIEITGEERELQPGEYILGRSSKTDIQIVHESVSRKHARLIVEEQAAYIEDLGSSNGTYINGKIIAGRTPLADGDKIHLGKALIEVEIPVEEAPTVLLTAGQETVEHKEESSPFEEQTEEVSYVRTPKSDETEPFRGPMTKDRTEPEPVSVQPQPRPQYVPPTRPQPSAGKPTGIPAHTPAVVQKPLMFRKASIGKRFVSLIVDNLLVLIPYFIIGFLPSLVFRNNFAITLLAGAIGILYAFGFIIYNIVFLPATRSQTIAMKMLGLKFVTRDMKAPIGWGPAIIRFLVAGFLSGTCLFLGYIWAFIDKENRTWHDIIAGTLVVEE